MRKFIFCMQTNTEFGCQLSLENALKVSYATIQINYISGNHRKWNQIIESILRKKCNQIIYKLDSTMSRVHDLDQKIFQIQIIERDGFNYFINE
jgi:hypothetical protein